METNIDLLILDCQNFESTLNSISRITQIQTNIIVDVLTKLPTDKYYSSSDIWDKLTEHTSNNDYSYDRVMWFHGSRIKDSKSYLKKGILPLDTIKPELISLLDFLNEKIDEGYSEPLKKFGTGCQLGTKLMIQKGGPYANLVRDTFFRDDNWNYDFLKLPEILFDIIHSNQKYKNRANKLTELYLEQTKSIIIKFYDTDTDEYYLKTASLYLFLKIKNLELATESNTCFDGRGEIISPERIVDIEVFGRY